MNIKRYLYILLIFLVLASLSAVSAADDNANGIISVDDNEELILDEAIDDDVSSANNNYDEELILETPADDLVGSENDATPLKEGATGSFSDLNKLINEDYSSNDTITLNGNYKYTDGDDDFVHGIVINRGVTIDGNGFTLDGSNSARMFDVETNSEVIIKNINFINGHATSGASIRVLCGGAIYVGPHSNNNKVINCNFTNNIAENDGGAIYGYYGTAINCTFTQNTAKIVYSGAIHKYNAINCTFIQNTAKYGGAAFDSTATNCTFINNTAQGAGAMLKGTAILCRFVEDSDTTSDTNIITPTFSVSDLTTVYPSGDKLLFNLTANDVNYDGFDAEIKIFKGESLIKTIHALSGSNNGWLVDLPIGTYKAVLSMESHPDVEPADATLTVNKIQTEITGNAITATYNVNKDLVITLKDSDGNPVSGVNVTVDLNGAKTYTTDSNGQVKVSTKGLAPNTYMAKVTFNGDTYYDKSTLDVKVTVNKASPKLTAKAKTFKFEDKTKKYTVTLKDNNGNVLKNKKIYLKVNGKTYTANTNSKGVATFKLAKLTKKGTYNAVISFAGDKDYNKISKSAKLTVKAPAWKTIAKGSKDKSMVKKIQRALKKNGFYLSYKGRYLKVDGLFHKYTQMAVKQFQKAKKLKVTGKVDYATAKKLKLI